MPCPPTHAEGLRRANAALPAALEVAFRPRLAGGRLSPQPFKVLFEGRRIFAASSLTGAILRASAVAKEMAGDGSTPPSGMPRSLPPQQPRLPFFGDRHV